MAVIFTAVSAVLHIGRELYLLTDSRKRVTRECYRLDIAENQPNRDEVLNVNNKIDVEPTSLHRNKSVK